MLLLQTARDHIHISLRLLQCDAGLEAGDGAQVAGGALQLVILLGDGPVKLPAFINQTDGQRLKISGHHAHDGVGLAVQIHLATDDIRITAEAPLPQPIAQDNHRVPAFFLLLRQKDAPQHRFSSHY